jgi:hypothetical protein
VSGRNLPAGLASPAGPPPVPQTFFPDWVMVGIPKEEGGVMLFASKTLAQGALQRVADGFDRIPIGPGGPVARVLREKVTIAAQMPTFVLIHADSYPAAFTSLWDLWQPRGHTMPEFPASDAT